MWFNAKIGYMVRDAKGQTTSRSEQFLFDAVLYGEVEKLLAERLDGRVKTYDYDIQKNVFQAVYDYTKAGDFYAVSIEEHHDRKGKVQVKNVKHLVVANSVHEAEQRAIDFIGKTEIKVLVVGAVRSKIIGVWHPKIEGWQEDFIERMNALEDEGKKSADAGQTQMFNKDGSPKMYGENADPNNPGTDAPADDTQKSEPDPNETVFQKHMRETNEYVENAAKVMNAGDQTTESFDYSVDKKVSDQEIFDDAINDPRTLAEKSADAIDDLLEQEQKPDPTPEELQRAAADADLDDDDFDQGPPTINQSEVDKFDGMIHDDDKRVEAEKKEPRRKDDKGRFLPRLTTQSADGTPDPQK